MSEAVHSASTRIAIDEIPVAYIEVDASGTIMRANRAALAMHTRAPGDLVGRNVWDLIDADERDSSFAAFQEQIATGEEPPVVYRPFYNQSGLCRIYEIHRNLILDEQQMPVGMRAICIDVTEMKLVWDEALRDRYWKENAVQARADAVILTDVMGIVYKMNAAAETISGWPASEVVGQGIGMALPILSFRPAANQPLDIRAIIERRSKGTATVLTRDHAKVTVEIITSPILEQNYGTICGIVTTLRKTAGA
jgi:PAS domain S-box-containing protein